MKPLHRSFLITTALVALAVLAVALAADDAGAGDDKAKEGKGGEPFVQVASGRARLKTGHRNAIEVELGKDLDATGKISITDWFGVQAVSGQVDVENKTNHKIHTAVSLILFDKDGKPLGCAAQSMDADPKEKTTWGGFVIKLPQAQLAQVRSYSYIWYEDDRPIGKR